MSGKRMTFQDRVKIQVFIEDPRNSSLQVLAKEIQLNRVTVYNEIISRRYSLGSKMQKFMNQEPLRCEKLKHYPFCCNTCPYRGRCSKEIFVYDAYNADEEYNFTKHNCNHKPSKSKEELAIIDALVSNRVKASQSLYHIIQTEKQLDICEQTLRRYIKDGRLSCGIIDLPRTVQRKQNDVIYPKRSRMPVNLLVGRMYADYLVFNETNKNLRVIQIDTVIGKRTDKKVILTIFEPTTKFQFGILVDRGSEAINKAILNLIDSLDKINVKLFDVIVTDNGSEFQGLPQIEKKEDGSYRFRLFYCDPYCSWQKGGCERNHEFFRYAKRKGISLDTISQFELNQIFSNINSLSRKSLNGSTPYAEFQKVYGVEVLVVLGIEKIEPHKIILKK